MDLEKLTEISNSVTVADQIIQVLNAICEKLGIVIDWSSKNITPYLLQLMERIVHYRMYKAIVFGSIFLILFIFFFVIIKKYLIVYDKETKDWDYNDDTWDGFFTPFMVVCDVIFLCFLIWNIIIIGECFIFPEKATLDYIKSFYNTYQMFH